MPWAKRRRPRLTRLQLIEPGSLPPAFSLAAQGNDIFVDKGAGVGKTRRVTANGSAAGRNDIMLYAVVEAETHEAASKMFEDHPHLGIPSSSIEIMEIHPLPGMKW